MSYHKLPPELVEMKNDFRAWYLEHKRYFGQVDAKSLPMIDAISRAEYKRQDHEEAAAIEQWLEALEEER